MALTATQQRDIYKLAVGMFSAAPGVIHFNDLANAINAGLTITQIYNILANSSSFQTLDFDFSNGSTNTQFATQFITSLTGTTLSASAKAEAIAFTEAQLNAGKSRGETMKIVIDALDAIPSTDANFGKAAAQFDNRITVAINFTEVLNSTETNITALQQVVAPVTDDPATVTAAINNPPIAGATLVFSDKIDNLSGTSGNDTFIGDSNTVSSADQATGGAGTDTLKLFDTVTLPSQTGIESLFLSSPDASLDISGQTFTSFTLDNEAMLAARTYTVAGTQAITLQNITAGTGSELNIAAASSVTSHSITLDKVGTGSGSNFVILDIEGTGVTTLSLTTANNASNLQLNNLGAKLATLNVAGDKALAINADTTTTVLTKVDASKMTAGGLTITLEDDTSVKNVTFLGSAGNDAVRFGVEFNELDSADGGAGTDTIAIAEGADLTTNSGAKIVNFETFDIRGGTGTYDMSKVTGITKLLVGAATSAAVTVNNLAEAATVEIGAAINAGGLTVNQKDAGVGSPNDTMTVTLNASAGFTTTGALTIPDIETLTINSTSSGTSQTHILSSISAPAATSVIMNASTANLTIASITAVNSVLFDASTSAKKVDLTFAAQTFTTNSGIEVKGGAANDTISFAAVTGFAGGQDSNLATPTFDQIKVTGGKGGDTVTVKASIDSDQYTFVFAAGDSVSVVGVANGFSADATDTITGVVNNVTYADAAGNRLVIDTEVSATAATIIGTAVVFGTTTVANAGDFVLDNSAGTATAFLYQDTDGDKIIETGEFAIQLVGAAAAWANDALSVSNGNLVYTSVLA